MAGFSFNKHLSICEQLKNPFAFNSLFPKGRLKDQNKIKFGSRMISSVLGYYQDADKEKYLHN